MAIRLLKDASSDLMKAFSEGMEEVARNITADLKFKGPYWSGQFYDLWVVESGEVDVPKNIPVVERPVPKMPRSRPSYTSGKAMVSVPKSSLEQGYTIGNRANYALYAMDLLPSPTGRRSPSFTTMDGTPVRLTAPKFWFDTYMNAQAGKTVNASLVSVFRRYQ